MNRVRKKSDQELEGLLSEYGARPARFSDDEQKRRHTEFEDAYGMNRLEGAGNKSEVEDLIKNLWVSGRISDKEYFELCDFDLERTTTHQRPAPR